MEKGNVEHVVSFHDQETCPTCLRTEQLVDEYIEPSMDGYCWCHDEPVCPEDLEVYYDEPAY